MWIISNIHTETSAESITQGITVAIVKGSTLELKSKGETVRVEWKQWFQSRHQSYTVCKYTLSGNPIPVYIQKDYDIPNHLTVDSRLQYGSQSGIVFFVYHDKSQTPFQQRFIDGMSREWLNNFFGRFTDSSAFIGDYLQDV